MTTATFSVAPDNTSDTTFRAWGAAIAAALAAVGLVKTADTGQVNWASVTKPASANTYTGYEIWRFADAMQATAPLFLKVEYGAGSPATWPALRIGIGKGSDGAGTLTGVLLAPQAVSSGATSTTTTSWYVSSGDGSLLCFAPAPAVYPGSGSAYWSFTLERSRTAAGAANGTGLHFAWQAANSSLNLRVINYASGVAFANSYASTWPACVPGGNSGAISLAGGGKVPVFAAVLTDGAGNWWQPKCVVVGQISDVGNLTQITVPSFGTYLPITGMIYYDSSSNGSCRAAIAWW